ncbi:MAG: response regulator [Rickettsiales bacterium]|jgi:two-component system phosphate regulon response regulator OmpR|nr:response regulator [Rickettsiales bacterium]
MEALSSHILVVDDDRRLRSLLKQYLGTQGYYVSTAENTAAARALLRMFSFDALVVDVMMPGETGIAFTEILKKNEPSLPVLMLTAMGEVEDRISGLESGADDYLSKPFEPRELVLRLKSIMRRREDSIEREKSSGLWHFGTLLFDARAGRLTRGEEPISLTSTELSILIILTQHEGQTMSREQLSQGLNDTGNAMNERSIDVQITRLRQKIEENPKKPRYLQTVWGEGYVLKAGV